MNNNLFVKTALHYGALSGIGIFLFYVLMYVAGYNVFGGVSMLGIWIPALFISQSIKFHRNSNLGGFINYGQGLKMGLATTIFSATLFGLAFYLLGTLYDPGLLNTYKVQAEISLEEGKSLMSDAIYDRAIESIDMVTMGSLAFSEVLNKILGGLIISLVAAGIHTRKGNPEELS